MKTETKNAPLCLNKSALLVRETGLEPVRCKPHAPQTCASASSATLALSVSRRLHYYTLFDSICQHFFESFLRFFYFSHFALKGIKNGGLVCENIPKRPPNCYSSKVFIALTALPSPCDLHSLSGIIFPRAKNPFLPYILTRVSTGKCVPSFD